jgi:hypothetical protein
MMKMQSLIDDPTRASRYLADQLSEAECAEYEARFIKDPEAIAELEATARLKIGLQRLRRNGELIDLVRGSGAYSPNRTWLLAMAASVAALAIGLSLWLPSFRTTSSSSLPTLAATASAFTDHNGHSLSVLSTTPLFRTRAERYDAVIDLPATRGALKLRVLPTAPTDSAHYMAALSRIKDDDTSGQPIAVSHLQPSAEDGFVDVYADSAVLSPGRYRLTLTREAGESAANPESDTFVVKVNPPH